MSNSAYSTAKPLNERFIAPPLSILDTQQWYWRERKRAWEKEAIISDATTRDGVLRLGDMFNYPHIAGRTYKERIRMGISFREYLAKYVSDEEKESDAQRAGGHGGGASLFDPVLAEVIATWFTPHPCSRVFDPMAGDTRKGGVFGMLGHQFTGIELRHEQVDVNNAVMSEATLPQGASVRYICDDGRNVAKHIERDSQDLLMCCPPYYDLEKYSDDMRDASNQKSYADFVSLLGDIFHEADGCLRDNRFAVVVIGDVRDNHGAYYGVPQDMFRIFTDNGYAFLNECILAGALGRNTFSAAANMRNRKVTKRHQQVLVFYKGDPRDIKEHFGSIDERTDIPHLINGRLHFPWQSPIMERDIQLQLDFDL